MNRLVGIVSPGVLLLFYDSCAIMRRRRGQTALMTACERGSAAAVERLLFWGADPNARDRPTLAARTRLVFRTPTDASGRLRADNTPLHFAAASGACNLGWGGCDCFCLTLMFVFVQELRRGGWWSVVG